MRRTGVMQVIDTLTIGGAERVAVNLANLLAGHGFRSYLCVTRGTGPLAAQVSDQVQTLALNRRHRFDARALRQMAAFIRKHDVEILHAHASSLFFARIAAWMTGIPMVWHDHFGRFRVEKRSGLVYGAATRGIGGVISVNQDLAAWARESLGVPAGRVWYVPNLVEFGAGRRVPVELPGKPGKRIVCIANFRPQKDHFNLLRAMEGVVAREPEAMLLLAGEPTERDYYQAVRAEIETRNLSAHVKYLGERNDVPDILQSCDIGVLSSASEGLPLSLLEYGAAGLPTVATDVGQCNEVMGGGRAGMLVPPGDPEALARALTGLLGSEPDRSRLGAALRDRVLATYSPEPVMRQIRGIYDTVLGARNPRVPDDERAIEKVGGMDSVRG